MPLRPRSEIEKISPVLHGGLDEAELKSMGLNPEDILDFSVCSNPYIAPPDMEPIIREVSVSRLPDSEATEFREVLAAKLGISPENIVAGNGSAELIRSVATAYFGKGDSVLLLEPTFGEYRMACRISGAEVIGHWAGEKTGFTHDITETIDLIRRTRPKGVFICNPNNPTGRYLNRRDIESVLEACRDSLLVLDEAYVAFVEKRWPSLDMVNDRNLVILRSMTKDYALAGLRLGYAVAGKDIIETLRRVVQPWNVNILAQKAGVAVLGDDVVLERSLKEIRHAAKFLVDEFTRIGFKPLPSDTHFFLIKVERVKEFRLALLRQGMLVRDCASFGMPNYIRIAARTLPECKKLVVAIEAMRGNTPEMHPDTV